MPLGTETNFHACLGLRAEKPALFELAEADSGREGLGTWLRNVRTKLAYRSLAHRPGVGS